MADSNKTLILEFLITPIVRFCIRNSINIQSLYESLKVIYLKEAKKHLKETGGKINTMKLHTITGLPRKDIGKIAAIASGYSKPKNRDLYGKLIAEWIKNHSFKTKDKIKKLSCIGPESDFYKLVFNITTDVSPSAILEHLKSIDLVEVRDGFAFLNKAGYFPNNSTKEIFEMLSLDLSDLISAVNENATSNDRDFIKNLHATTEYTNIDPDKTAQIKEWFLELGKEIHKRTRIYLAQFDNGTSRKSKPITDGTRIVFSSFSFTEDKND